MLNTITHGTPTALPPLLIAHGLFGSARNWGAIARRMADTRLVLAVDMRNHGESGWYRGHSYGEMAGDLAEVIAPHGQADVLGHSMGGKAAMHLALTQGGLINRLVVVDIAPVAYGHSLNHLIAAMRALDIAGLDSRAEADRRLAPAIEDPALRAFLLQSLDLKEARWRLNLDILEQAMQATTGWPGTQGRFDGPTLFLTGALSDYVRPEHWPEIRAGFPNASHAGIAGAGHWLHAGKPREFEAALRAFLG